MESTNQTYHLRTKMYVKDANTPSYTTVLKTFPLYALIQRQVKCIVKGVVDVKKSQLYGKLYIKQMQRSNSE